MPETLSALLLEIALDIGHSSIGWAAFEDGKKFNLLGTGVVLFPADDCLAVNRRDHRRQRRHVRATRKRIERLKQLLLHIGVLSESELNRPGCAWPWKLAAEVLRNEGRTLTWPELWDVLRWYAHNRGYDGNARWSCEDEEAGDTEKVERAKELMREYSAPTMAEFFCAALEIDPLGTKKSSGVRFKGLNAAFPRQTVYTEVRTILERHIGKLPGLSLELLHTLIGNDNYSTGEWDDDAWKTPAIPTVKLPKRYCGSYLFGQSIPRFDNRIISACPVTYQRIFSKVLAETNDRDKANKQALRDSKVPAKKCREFLLYRWAMILANLRVNRGKGMESLSVEERKAIHQLMVTAGHLTKKQLKDAVIQNTGALVNNVDTCFLTPRSDEGLWLRLDKPPTGRAPYTRQVLKEAAREVFSGKDPREKDGCLYQSNDVKEAQLQRSLESKTNNHLVRHRVLMTRRLVRDIINVYAAKDATRIGRITIEVNRDLQKFSGKTNKEIEGELTQMLKDHSGVVKKLERDLAGTPHRITPGLIRKARIATDLDWRCPYTGKNFDALSLATGAYDKDHIIPRSLRPSDSLESLVITSRAVNSMKGQRTALEFIKLFGGKDIEGAPTVGKQKSNLLSLKQFQDFVGGLDIKTGHIQDRERKKKRIKLMELERYEEKGFLPKDLTQTSHLVRLAATELAKEFNGLDKKPHILSLPGSVTGEVRKGWKLYGCLAAHNSEVQKLLDRKEAEPDLNIKQELRNITHQHHALDACVIGYASHFIPNDGHLWEMLVKRNRRPEENEALIQRGYFAADGQKHARLRDLSTDYKNQITSRLAECRVVQHVPKKMGGLAGLEENTRGIVAIEVPAPKNDSGKKAKQPVLNQLWNNKSGQPLPDLTNIEEAIVHLQQFGPRDPQNGDKRTKKYTKERISKLLGVRPENGNGKLRAIKGVRVITANYGLALWRKEGKPDGEPMMRIIPWHKVWPRLKEIAVKENGGQWPEVFRNGQVINVPNAMGQSDYRGYWQITSIKNNKSGLAVNMIRPDMVKERDGVDWAGINVNANTLVKCGMKVVASELTGVSLKM